jgi:hypothetical protein
MHPPPIWLAMAAGALTGVILGLRLLLGRTAGSPDAVSWIILPGLVRGIRAWVRPRPPRLPVSLGGTRAEEGGPLEVSPHPAADEGDEVDEVDEVHPVDEVDDMVGVAAHELEDVARPVLTSEVREREVGLRR